MWTEEEVEKALSNLSPKELDRFADNLKKIALFVGKRELRKMFAKKIAKIDAGITRLEQKHKLGDYAGGIRKSIIGQDDIAETKLWPSISGG